MDIGELATGHDLLALGEPTHQEPRFGRVRNELLAALVRLGFRSIALETDRVAALAVNDHVHTGLGSLDEVVRAGFSHGFGDLAANRELVAWLRRHNERAPAAERVSFHGFDAQTENTSAPSPRPYLAHARDYLGLDLDLVADDERWGRTEAILDPAASMGATAEAEALRAAADDLHDALHARAPQVIAATSRAEWVRARTHLMAGIGLLRYHKQAARPIADFGARIAGLLEARDVQMAHNLLDIRAEASGPTLVFAHNAHLQRSRSTLSLRGETATWSGAGSIVGSLLGGRYAFVAGSLGRSDALGLGEPEPDTYEGALQRRVQDWGLVRADTITAASTRTTSAHGYNPLDRAALSGATAVLHIS